MLVTSGGRVLGVSAVAGTLKDAVDLAYRGVWRIAFYGAFYRQDIARKDPAVHRSASAETPAAAAPKARVDWS